MNCHEVDELSGAYALGAVTEDEARAVADHLVGCSAHPELVDLQSTVLALAYSAPDIDPPPELRARISEAIRSEPREFAPAPREIIPPPRRLFGGWSLPRLAGLGFAAALVLLVVGLAANMQFSGGSGTSSQVVQLQDPSGSVNGTITVYTEEDLAVLEASGLQPLDEGKTYQMWALSDDAPVGIAVFEPSPDGTISTSIEADLSGVDLIAVTVEPAGGSAMPTTDPVLTGEL